MQMHEGKTENGQPQEPEPKGEGSGRYLGIVDIFVDLSEELQPMPEDAYARWRVS